MIMQVRVKSNRKETDDMITQNRKKLTHGLCVCVCVCACVHMCVCTRAKCLRVNEGFFSCLFLRFLC